MAVCGFECAVQVADVVATEYGAEVAECHRKAQVVVWLLLLRRYLDDVGAVLGAKGGAVLRTSAGRWREGIGDP